MKTKILRLLNIFYFASFFLGILFNLSANPNVKSTALPTTYEVNSTLFLKINSSINPATFNYLKSAYTYANKNDFQLLLISINTPGGLVSTTKEILTLFGSNDIPVAIWITPEGASATSAGAIIASSAHFLFMSNGTNIGAATPVQMGSDIPKDLKRKAINDLVALVQSLSETRGRNSEKFGEMINKASSFKSSEALEFGLIDSIANSTKDIFDYVDNKTISIKGKSFKIKLTSTKIHHLEMDYGQKLLNIFADPNLTYILFIIGAALIYLELQSPGGFIAGSLGALSLLLAGIGFQIIPLNLGALGLIVLAFILFVLEIYITSYGILTLGGIISLITGSLFLYRTDEAYIHLSQSVILSSVGAVVTFVFFIAFFFIKDVRQKKKTTFNRFIGEDALVVDVLEELEGHYLLQVKIHGELWKATSSKQKNIGDHCKIVGQDKDTLTLII